MHAFLLKNSCGRGKFHDFAGMRVLDKWTCTNGRQTIFSRERGQRPPAQGDGPRQRKKTADRNRDYRAAMTRSGILIQCRR